ncbi:MAG: hypothetical protein QM679_04895 [Patulibacter sp.]
MSQTAALDTSVEPLRAFDVCVEPLESLEAPGFWGTAGGVAGGVVIGYGTVALFVWT